MSSQVFTVFSYLTLLKGNIVLEELLYVEMNIFFALLRYGIIVLNWKGIDLCQFLSMRI